MVISVMARFPKGYVRDSRDYGYRPHSHLVAATGQLQPHPTLLRFRGPPIWQDGVAECVGAATRRCVQMWHMANLHEPQPEISDIAAYTLGRLQESAGQDPDSAPPLQDWGSQPGLVLKAAQKVGVVLREDWPGPDHPGWDASRVNSPPDPRALVKAYDMRGLDFFEVKAPDAASMRKAVRDCFLRLQPVMWAMYVDTGFESNAGEVITSVDTSDPNGGGHMLAGLDATSDDYLVADNWWRNDSLGVAWGAPDGTFRISWECLAAQVQQMFAVQAAPMTRRNP